RRRSRHPLPAGGLRAPGRPTPTSRRGRAFRPRARAADREMRYTPMDRSPASLRVGLIGAGGISAVHAAAWHHLGATVLVYSRDGAGQLAAQYGFEAVPSLAELWDRVDVVDIVTPTPT